MILNPTPIKFNLRGSIPSRESPAKNLRAIKISHAAKERIAVSLF